MPIEPKSQRSGSADNHGLDSEVAAASAAAMECRAVSDFPEWMAPAVFGAIGGVLAVLAVTIFIIHFIRYVKVRGTTGSDKNEQKLA